MNDKFLSSEEPTTHNYWTSISDMMSGLMIIFLFISVAYMNSVTKEKNKIEQVAVTWNETQESLFMELQEEFKDDLPRWKASLARETLSVRFEEPSVFFEAGSSNLTSGFKKILDDFFPRYINLLRKYQENITEVRIEGHTSSEWAGASDKLDAYFHNMELSQDRTRSVLQYCLTIASMQPHISWAIGTITANGLSSSSPIMTANGKEDPGLSRRVEFRVRTDAEKRIVTILGGVE